MREDSRALRNRLTPHFLYRSMTIAREIPDKFSTPPLPLPFAAGIVLGEAAARVDSSQADVVRCLAPGTPSGHGRALSIRL
jgi:hypothetical protein